mgnify:CR=1 FL=1
MRIRGAWNSSVEERARSALRARFYEYAQKEVDAAYEVEMPDGTIEVSIPILPRNTNEMKATDLYTDSVYPVSGGALHAWEGCPAVAEIEGLGSISALDSGAYSTCETCGFDAASMGSVAAASTSVENGFEHHSEKSLNRHVITSVRKMKPCGRRARFAVLWAKCSMLSTRR